MESSDCESSVTSLSFPSLYCEENEACFEEEEEELYMNLDPSEDEYIENLLRREAKICIPSDNCSPRKQSWLDHNRLDTIEWILDAREHFGFQFRTAYLCVACLDLFLSKRSIDNEKFWAIRLLSVACLSLAAKMEELRGEVPGLSECQMDAHRYFDSKEIRRMELMVLDTLEWKMPTITAFEFLPFFINKLSGESKSRELVSRTRELLLDITREINLTDHRPSVVAAAAVLAAAFDGQLTRETMEYKMSLISSCDFPENNHIFFCYNLLKETEMGKSKTPKRIVSPNLSSSNDSSSNDDFESWCSSALGKRRFLCYTGDEIWEPE